MKKFIWLLFAGLLLVAIGCREDSFFDLMDPISKNSNKGTFRNGVDTEALIDGGIAWLLTKRHADGSFSGPSDLVSRTGMAIVKLCDRSIEKGFQPLDPDGPYYDAIVSGLEYIMAHPQNGDCGTAFSDGGVHHYNYNTAWALMAFAATRDPAYQDTARAAAIYLSNSQSLAHGGWGYYCEDTERWNDQSNSGYSILALVAAENYLIPSPGDLADKISLSGWIDFTQNDIDNPPQADDGGCGYENQFRWVNVLKTGNLLFEMRYCGDDKNTPRAGEAITYIQKTWNSVSPAVGWKPKDYQAMYTTMKGLEAMEVDLLEVGGNPVDWYNEFIVAIDNTKLGIPGDYHWPGGTYIVYVDDYVSTIFALLTLEKIVELPFVNVEFDIKPTSCPNPFNMNAKGVLPVAILGTADFDVTQIDVSTVLLEGVQPLRSNYEDVTAPVEDRQDVCDCTTAGPDGYGDLTLKFDRQLLAQTAVFQDASDGDVVEMTITGQLLDGKSIIGKDCVVILKKGKEKKMTKGENNQENW